MPMPTTHISRMVVITTAMISTRTIITTDRVVRVDRVDRPATMTRIITKRATEGRVEGRDQRKIPRLLATLP
jgi:hypothetical protein